MTNQGQKGKEIDLNGLGAASVIEGETGSQSTYLLEEVSTFARTINKTLKNEPALSERLPINPENDDLFNSCSDGIVLIYLLREIDPTLIDLN